MAEHPIYVQDNEWESRSDEDVSFDTRQAHHAITKAEETMQNLHIIQEGIKTLKLPSFVKHKTESKSIQTRKLSTGNRPQGQAQPRLKHRIRELLERTRVDFLKRQRALQEVKLPAITKGLPFELTTTANPQDTSRLPLSGAAPVFNSESREKLTEGSESGLVSVQRANGLREPRGSEFAYHLKLILKKTELKPRDELHVPLVRNLSQKSPLPLQPLSIEKSRRAVSLRKCRRKKPKLRPSLSIKDKLSLTSEVYGRNSGRMGQSTETSRVQIMTLPSTRKVHLQVLKLLK